jgi:hypothetical protein
VQSDNGSSDDLFAKANDEWLRQGGQAFRERHFGISSIETEVGIARWTDKPFYKSTYWLLVRDAILQRDQSRCFRCREPATQVHHLDYRFIGEDHKHPETLVSICRPCHGLVEYARKAHSLGHRILGRISACEELLGKAVSTQQALKVSVRLLEYMDDLTLLKDEVAELFANNSPASRSLQPRVTEADYEKHALRVFGDLSDNPNIHVERILAQLRSQLADCKEFERSVMDNGPQPKLKRADRDASKRKK